MNWFKRSKPLVIDLPEVCGPRLCLAEVQAALEGKQSSVEVRALLQIMQQVRHAALAAAKERNNASPSYNLGGAQAIEDVLEEVTAFLAGQSPSADMRRFFVVE